jgi:hypothetical protein
MGRELTAGMEAEVVKTSVSPIFLVEMDFASGFVRAWSGYGELSWNGYTWLGAGELMEIDPVEETTSFVANGASFKLNGIPSAMVSIALDQDYQGRPATLYLGMLDSSGAVITDPAEVYGGLMDTMEVDDSGEAASIIVRVESHAVALKRPKEWRYTHEDQQIDYPGDLGLEYVAGLQDKEIVWKPA